MRDHVDVLLGWVGKLLIVLGCILGAVATVVVVLKEMGRLGK